MTRSTTKSDAARKLGIMQSVLRNAVFGAKHSMLKEIDTHSLLYDNEVDLFILRTMVVREFKEGF